MYKTVHLKKGKEESLKRFHPWIFSGAIHHLDEDISEGEIVRVVTFMGDFIAIGHYQIGSIAVRVLSFQDIHVDDTFWEARLGSALGVHNNRFDICKALIQIMDDRIEQVYYKSETTLPYKAELGQENGFIYGSTEEDVAIENGLKFHVDWLKGQKTGFFIDQRENRSLLEHYAKGRSVLNMFCYTGGFSVYAMRGQAKLVHSVDSSAKAVELTNQNIALNFPQDTRHEAFCEDAFKYLDTHDGKYDLIVLDPPAFAKHRSTLRNALKGYTRLNVKGFQQIKSGGILFTFSCSQVVTKEQFRNAVFTAAAQAGRKVRILHQLHQPADHPINIYHPEGEYLKGLVLYVE